MGHLEMSTTRAHDVSGETAAEICRCISGPYLNGGALSLVSLFVFAIFVNITFLCRTCMLEREARYDRNGLVEGTKQSGTSNYWGLMFLTHIHFFHSVIGMARTSGTLGSIRLGKFSICFILPTYLYILSGVAQPVCLVQASFHLNSTQLRRKLPRLFPFSENFSSAIFASPCYGNCYLTTPLHTSQCQFNVSSYLVSSFPFQRIYRY